MHDNFWQRQTKAEPLFANLLWSRPENRAHAGKLLIIGGNAHGFSAPALAYGESIKAGVGSPRVMLPEHVRKMLPKGVIEAEFAPSTPSGSFAKLAIGDLLDQALWADGVLLAGDFGRNSETAIVLEQFAAKYSGQLTITQDAADYFIGNPQAILKRANTAFVISFAQLQKLAINAKFTKAFTFDMDFLRLVELLHEFTTDHTAAVVTKLGNNLFVAVNGQVSTTKLDEEIKVWRVAMAAHASVWWLQNPSKTYDAITTSVISYLSPTGE